MRYALHWFLLIVGLVLLGCSDMGDEPPEIPPALIMVKVHWGDQGVPDIKVLLVETGDTLRTDSSGMAVFSVPPGKYTVRAFGINTGGPVARYVDVNVNVKSGATHVVDIVDCLPCV